MRIPNLSVRYLPLGVFTLCLIGLVVLYIVDPDVPQKPSTVTQEPAIAPLPTLPPAMGPQEPVTDPSVPVNGLQEPDAGLQPVAPPPITVDTEETSPPKVEPAPRCRPSCRPSWRWRRW